MSKKEILGGEIKINVNSIEKNNDNDLLKTFKLYISLSEFDKKRIKELSYQLELYPEMKEKIIESLNK